MGYRHAGKPRIIDAASHTHLMAPLDLPRLPTWVAPRTWDVWACVTTAGLIADDTGRDDMKMVVTTIRWVAGLGLSAPVTGRWDTPITERFARQECWLAICGAAGHDATPDQIAQIGANRAYQPNRIDLGTDCVDCLEVEFMHGTWRTLVWLLGDHPEPPAPVPDRDAHGRPILRPEHMPALEPPRDSLEWSQWAARERDAMSRRHTESITWYERGPRLTLSPSRRQPVPGSWSDRHRAGELGDEPACPADRRWWQRR